MAEPLDREGVIRLLDQLGSDQDEDVLEAARELHVQINAADLDWNELLVADTSVDPGDAGDAGDSGDTAEPPAGKTGKDGSTLELIEEILAKSNRSDALREELEEYKIDIANGEFHARDHRYVRSLYERLTK
jgi:hypothetical protein